MERARAVRAWPHFPSWGWRSLRTGIAVGIVLIATWLFGMFWGRAALVGAVVAVALVAAAFFFRPDFAAAILAFMVTGGVNYLAPGSLLLVSVAAIGVTFYRKLYGAEYTWHVPAFVIWSGLL